MLADETVLLEDQFDTFEEAYVEFAWFFSNPVEKLHDEMVTPILNQDHHLTIYNILCEGTFGHYSGVDVYNQFGIQQLNVDPPVYLAVPTQKLDPGPHGPPVGLDHFLLYPVIGGTPMEVVVSLNDQFHEEPEVWVLEPVYFANPVQKTHGDTVTPIEHPEAHLVFYAISGGTFDGLVVAENQFSLGPRELGVYNPVFLAVPSLKLRVHLFKVDE
jgi:hypothetical protein